MSSTNATTTATTATASSTMSKILPTSKTTQKSEQGNRVQQELEVLRQKHLAKHRRDKLKDLCSAPLTTPEEAKAFLAMARKQLHQKEISHQPPSNLTQDGMDAWFLSQKQRERELRERRREAEAILRGYRGGRESLGVRESIGLQQQQSHSAEEEDDVKVDDDATGGGRGGRNNRNLHVDPNGFPAGAEDTDTTSGNSGKEQLSHTLRLSATGSESLEDPRSYQKYRSRTANNKSTSMDHDNDDKLLHEDVLLHQHQYQQRPKDTIDNKNASEQQQQVQEDTVWLDFISSEPGSKFPPAKNRYHLYLSYACPGSHRALIVRALKGLDDVVSVTYLHPTWRLTNPDNPKDKHRGWVFGDPNGKPFTNTIQRGGPFPPAYTDNECDPFDPDNTRSIRQIYERAGDTSGKYTIPLLYDTELQTIVNNESSDIAYMLNSCFNDFAKHPDVDLYTEFDEDGVAKLTEVSEWLSPLMIHGVYRCGFAKNQRAYDKAIAELCSAFDRADDILQKQRFLTGNDVITDADIRLFVSLLRFDEVYAVYFKANARLVMLTPALLNYCREIYQIPGVAETCHMDQIKAHFYGSHAEWNKYSVIPRGLGFMELLEMPHDRHTIGIEMSAAENEINNEEDNIIDTSGSSGMGGGNNDKKNEYCSGEF